MRGQAAFPGSCASSQRGWFCSVPSCGYRAEDTVDDDIDGCISELSKVINKPSAEGFFTVAKSFSVNSSPS
jgi:hypothetical protein